MSRAVLGLLVKGEGTTKGDMFQHRPISICVLAVTCPENNCVTIKGLFILILHPYIQKICRALFPDQSSVGTKVK